MTTTPFAPMGATVTVAASTTSATASLAVPAGGVRVVNGSSAIAFVRFYSGTTQVATSADMPILAGATETFDIGNAPKVAVLLASGTGNVYFTSGRGL